MHLGTKGRYAVMAMADLARAEVSRLQGAAEDAPNDMPRGVALAEIAARQEISLSYLEQLFARLRRKGLVTSARGPGGGYRLSREATGISVADIVLAVDEPLRATRCGVGGAKHGCMTGGVKCLTHDLWAEMGRRMHEYLASVSLADVLAGRLSPELAEAA